MLKLATVATVFAVGLLANGCSQSPCEDMCDQVAKCNTNVLDSMKEETINACKDYCDETDAKNERASCADQYDAVAKCKTDNKDAICDDEQICKAEGDSYSECMVAYCEDYVDQDGVPIDPYCCSEHWVEC